MAVRIRMKKFGRRHRPYFRICVMDSRTPRDGRAIEEVGTYDPMIDDTDKRVTMKADRIDYWLGVGAQPSEKVRILIDKYKGKVPEVRMDPKHPRAAVMPQIAVKATAAAKDAGESAVETAKSAAGTVAEAAKGAAGAAAEAVGDAAHATKEAAEHAAEAVAEAVTGSDDEKAEDKKAEDK